MLSILVLLVFTTGSSSYGLSTWPDGCVASFSNDQVFEKVVVRDFPYPPPRLKGRIIEDRFGKKYHLMDIGNLDEWSYVKKVKKQYFEERVEQRSNEVGVPKKIPIVDYDEKTRTNTDRLRNLRKWTTQTVVENYREEKKAVSDIQYDLIIDEDTSYLSEMTLSHYFVLFEVQEGPGAKAPWEFTEKEWKEALLFTTRVAFSRVTPVRSFIDPIRLLKTRHHLPHFTRNRIGERGRLYLEPGEPVVYPQAAEALSQLKENEQWAEFGRLVNFTRGLEPGNPRKIDGKLVYRLLAEPFLAVDKLNCCSELDAFPKVTRIVGNTMANTTRQMIEVLGLPYERYLKPKISRTNDEEEIIKCDTDSQKFKDFVGRFKSK